MKSVNETMDELTSKLYETLQEHGRYVTTPVAVKLAKEGEVTPRKIPEKYHQIAPQEGEEPE